MRSQLSRACSQAVWRGIAGRIGILFTEDMDMFKKKGNSKEAWLDWLSDDAPSQEAQAALRRQHVQRANTYQPRQFTPQSGTPAVNPSLSGQQTAPEAPTQPVTPQQPPQPVQTPTQQPQAVQATTASVATPVRPQPTPGQGVSIQINIPQLHLDKFRRFKARIVGWIGQGRAWFVRQWVANKPRTIAVSAVAVLVLASLLARPLLVHGKHSDNTAAVGASAPKHAKPTFAVVVPSSKPRLATPDGVHAAYDGTKNSYSYSDSIGSNGFIVSEQPIPDKFNTADEAVKQIGPQIYGPSNGHIVSTNSGDAYVTSRGKTAQTVVFSVHNLLMFIQSSHVFSDTDVQDYINGLL